MIDKTTSSFDQKLIRQLKSGNATASQVWFETYHQSLFNFVAYKVSSHDDAEEIVQETFINCLKHLPLFNEKSSVLTWMIGIARHEIADYYRKKYAKKAISFLPLFESISDELVSDSAEVSKKVTSVLKKMRSDYRELLLLKYIDGKKIKVIAREMKRSFKSVEADLFRARKDFKELYVSS